MLPRLAALLRPNHACSAMCAKLPWLAAARPRGVLHVLDLVEWNVDQLAADLLHPSDVDRLYDVTRLGIDRHRAARAVPFQALGGRDQRVAVGLAAGLLQGLVDGVHAVIAADREEVGVTPVHLVEHLAELDVTRILALVVVVPRRDDAEARVAHALERLLRRGLARSQNFGLGEIDAALGECLAQRRRLRAAWDEDVD